MMLPLCRACQCAASRGAQEGTHRKELKEEAILAVAELQLEDPVCPDLDDRGDFPRSEELAQASDKGRGGGGGSAGKLGQMASKARVDNELLLAGGLGELEEQDLRGQVVDVGHTQSHQALVEFVSDDLRGVRVSERAGTCTMPGLSAP